MSNQRTYKKLGEVINILNGFAFKSSNYVNDGIRVIRIANVQKGKIVDDAPAFYPLSYESEISRYMLREGDILLSLTGNVGRVGVLQKEMLPAALNQRVACLRFRDDDILPKYIFHLLNSDVFEQACIASSRGIAQLNMSTEWLKEYLLPIPPLSEQQSIVKELDAINVVIAAKNAQLRELDALAQALFYDIFGDPITNPKGWPVKKLGEICKFLNGDRGVNYPSVKDFVSEGIPFINAGHLQNGKICFDDMNYITKEKYDLLHAGKIQKDDILFCLRGSLGKFALIDFEDNGAIASSLVIIRSLNEILPLYIMGYLLTSAVKEQIERANNGSSQPNLSAKSVADFRLPLPPLDLQQAFAVKIKAIEAQKTTLRQSIAEFESLLAQRMDYHFN